MTFWALAPASHASSERGKAIGALALDPSLEIMFYLLYNFSEKMEKKGGSHGESDHDDQTELELSIAAC
jgi:hypothetical protein